MQIVGGQAELQQLLVRSFSGFPGCQNFLGDAAQQQAVTKAQAVLSKSVTNKGERPHYLRGYLEAGRFMPFENQESHALFALSRANALLRIGAGEQISESQTVEVVLLR